MHPLLKRGRLGIYLLISVPLTAVIATLIVRDALLPETALFVIPVAVLQTFIGLAAWYPCRAVPLSGSRTTILVTHLAGAALASAVWTAGVAVLARMMTGSIPAFDTIRGDSLVIWYAVGVLLYLLSVAVHYLIIAVERAGEVEREGLALQIAAREAELRALRAQIDPHFLFNSLHSISSLCGSDPAAARKMSSQLGDFLRSTVRAGSQSLITVGEELELAKLYLETEQVRFGDRLAIEVRIEDGAGDAAIPPLLIQPLAENAVRHGIAHTLEGGRISILATRTGDRLRIVVENPADPDRPRKTGENVGLRNVAARLDTLFGRDGRIDVREDGGVFRADVELPFSVMERQ
jgi:two-component system sensor histidine kinase AlgZ